MDILWIFKFYFAFLGNQHVGPGYNSFWRLGVFSGWMQVLSCLLGLAFPGSRFFICIFCMALMQNSTPISLLYKGNEGFLWKLQPKSPSVYAEPSDLDTMQINSVLIWMLPEIGGWRPGSTICTGPFLCTHHPPPPEWLVVTLRPLLAPCKITQAPAAHFILTFRKGTQPWWISGLLC